MQINVSSADGRNAVGTQIDVETLPVTHEYKGTKSVGVFLTLFSLLWGGLPTLFLIISLARGNFEPEMLFVLIFTLVGTGLFILGLSLLFRKKVVRIDREGVTVNQKSLKGRESWTEPFGRYRGVACREEYHSGGKNSPSYTLYIVELAHDDASKVIQLYSSRSSTGHRKIWEDYCRKLGMNAVEKDGDGYIERQIEDLDKSAAELVREGKIDVDFDPSKNVPEELDVSPEDDDLLIIVRKKKSVIGSIIGLTVAFGLPGVFIYVGFFKSGGVGIVMGAMGVLFMFLMLAVVVIMARTKACIRISKDRVKTYRLGSWGEIFPQSIQGSEIESVKVYKKDGTSQDAVWLVGDNRSIAIGGGLKREALEWLKNCVLTVISSAVEVDRARPVLRPSGQ